MARKQSGGLNKLLNFIGLVDDDDTRDTYGEEYSSDNYGRRAAYTPPRQSARASRTAPARRPQPRQSQPASRASRYDSGSRFDSGSRYAPGSRYDAGRDRRSYDDYRPAASSRFEDPGYGAPRAQRQPSRFSQQPDAGYGNPPQRAAMAPRNARVSPRSRTVMYSLHALEDCCEVIDQLIANNTVVLTMDELDGHLLQRAVDTLSGAVFALHASIRKASDRTYLVAPMSVEINEAYDVDRRF
ncbi:MAG: cell division protein SepF [Clostridia bacterium]|nr:cell division protein SepF [Clostridia bacterium]